MIAIKGLSHQIAGSPILTDIHVTIPKGKLTAIIGPNGAGKSTLLNIVARQLSQQTGEITLDGDAIGALSRRDLALRLAAVAQTVGIASRLRVRDLVGFGRWPHSQGRTTDKDIRVVNSAVEEFELADIADRFLDEISGGQRQRAFIAMAFAQETDWLLLDEPLNNLDLVHARVLMARLQRLTRDHGKSVALVVHEVNYAAAWADHVIGVKDGKIVLDGPPEDVLTSEGLKALFGLTAQVITEGGRPVILHHV